MVNAYSAGACCFKQVLVNPESHKRIADLNTLSSKAKTDAKSVLNHSLLLAAGLVAIGFACAWMYQLLTSRSVQR